VAEGLSSIHVVIKYFSQAPGLTPITLACEEAEIRRIVVLKPTPGKEFTRSYLEKTHHKKGACGVAQVAEMYISHDSLFEHRKQKENHEMSQQFVIPIIPNIGKSSNVIVKQFPFLIIEIMNGDMKQWREACKFPGESS
jgi:hypothetical protein